MQDPRIVYINDAGGVSIVIPAPEALDKYGITAIASKDVPFGKPYAIMEAADIPEDRTFRGAWEIDPALLVHGVGGPENSFAPAVTEAEAPATAEGDGPVEG